MPYVAIATAFLHFKLPVGVIEQTFFAYISSMAQRIFQTILHKTNFALNGYVQDL